MNNNENHANIGNNMGGKTKRTKDCNTLNRVVISSLQGVLRPFFASLKMGFYLDLLGFYLDFGS